MEKDTNITPDFLCVGHLCHDIGDDDSLTPGGTAAYASLAARAWSKKTAVLTSTGPDFKFPGLFQKNNIAIKNKPSPQTTIFKNIYSGTIRTQYILGCAGMLARKDLPPAWAATPIVLLGPIAGEVDDSLLQAFSSRSLVGGTLQGWLRQWDKEGKISPKEMNWKNLQYLDIAFLSQEDLPDSRALGHITKNAKIAILTMGERGSIAFYKNKIYSYPAYTTKETDPTGAGDLFATAFLIHYSLTRKITDATAFAHAAASCMVESEGPRPPLADLVIERYSEYIRHNKDLLPDV